MAEDDFGFDQNAPEEEEDYGGNFGPDDPPDESDDFSIFDVGLFSLLGSIASFFARPTPLGIGLSIGGRVLDKVAGTETTISDAARGGVKSHDNRRNFEGDDGPTDAVLREQKEREERQASRRRAATTEPVVSGVPALAAAPGTPSSRVAMAFAGKRRPGTLFATEEGFADVLGG